MEAAGCNGYNNCASVATATAVHTNCALSLARHSVLLVPHRQPITRAAAEAEAAHRQLLTLATGDMHMRQHSSTATQPSQRINAMAHHATR